MSISAYQPSRATASSAAISPSLPPSSKSARNLAPYVDIQNHPFSLHGSSAATQQPTREGNPVADLIPDEVYILLRSNDMINEKAVRDYVIRRFFRSLREEQKYKTVEAIEKIKEAYPYLQMDTIRKIIYRINPGGGRKVML